MATIKITPCPFCGAENVVTNEQGDGPQSSVGEWHMERHTNPKSGKTCKRVWYVAPMKEAGVHYFGRWDQVRDADFKPSIYYAGSEVFLKHTGKHENKQMQYDQDRINLAREEGRNACCIYRGGRSAFYEEGA